MGGQRPVAGDIDASFLTAEGPGVIVRRENGRTSTEDRPLGIRLFRFRQQ
jgi:hypothetical protein